MRTRVTKHGDAQRTTKEKQGPLTAHAGRQHQQTRRGRDGHLFNQMVQLLAQRGLFAAALVALDESKLPTPKSYEGCGKLKQSRRVKVKGR